MNAIRFGIFLLVLVLSVMAYPVKAESKPAAEISSKQYKDQKLLVRSLGKCKIIIKDLQGGQYEGGSVGMYLKAYVKDLLIPLHCHPRSDHERLEIALGAKQVDGKWQPAGGYEKGCDPQKLSKLGICEYVRNLPFMPEEHMRAIPLKGANWQGVGILVDDTTGRERTRQRNFRYCLHHAEVALCGRVDVRNLMKPHNDVLATVLAVLNSIEFVDDVPTDPLAASPR